MTKGKFAVEFSILLSLKGREERFCSEAKTEVPTAIPKVESEAFWRNLRLFII
jgi:hypothetical protein